ncbi:sugar phosphate isomerase/epimerase family protein [Bacillus inaquosorum]|nr:sugar phosphate isomerase/epimerase family protein [Bacillus inaquosorum]MCY7902832.1 sugar phosphate isomerase/epimerase [Bacillus inaquosorum]MCY8284569.1 sugar phosphate isomerase/epimerase [Bacillus inaquosorum]MCY9453474.1 sugar phosphate isomerase/epimerase [Bacillus inaquosorum]
MRLNNISLSGIADEAAQTLDMQIKAHQMLGWQSIELRSIQGLSIAELDEAAFNDVVSLIQSHEMKVTAFSSKVGNWERPITFDKETEKEELKRIAERMHRLKTRYVRIMSYPNDGLEPQEWKEKVIARVKELTTLAEQEDIILLHENCAGWGGQSAANTIELITSINSQALRLLFDIGNGITYGYDSLSFLKAVYPYVEYVHMKDSLSDGQNIHFTFPGAGESKAAECLAYLADLNYKGVISIEPHIHLIPHLGEVPGNENDHFASYIKYGRETEQLVRSIMKTGVLNG